MKKRGKNNFFGKNYKLSWDYLKESKNFIYFSVLLFFLIAIIGFLYPIFFVDKIVGLIKELVEQTKDLNGFELIIFIFLNNLQTSFFGLILGVLLGIFPLFFIVLNGYVLGFVSALSVNTSGFLILLKLIPHGIFELPAVFISLGLGIKLGTFIFHKHKIKDFNKYFINSLRVFLFIVVPLLIIAAIIEGILMTFFG